MNFRRVACACLSVTMLSCCLVWQAWADGMVTYHTDVGNAETLSVQATAQRAILWYRDQTWQIIIQPQFDRAAGAAAWVVPFPVVPVVSQASSDLFEAMELLTAPVFIPYCYEEEDSGRWFGCAGSTASGENGSTDCAEADSLVSVWSQGSTPELEYVVLQSAGGEALIEWLESNGYTVPEALSQNPDLVKDRYIFAAKLLSGMDPANSLSPVSFSLPNVPFDDIAYPMRLTALVAPEQGMELVLWVVASAADALLAPENVDWLPLSADEDSTKTDWQKAVAKTRSAFHPMGGLVLEYSDYGAYGLANSPYNTDSVHLPMFDEPMTTSNLGLTKPEEWPAEIAEMIEFEYAVAKYAGRLKAEAMAEDIQFGVSAEVVSPRDGFYFHRVACSDIESQDDVVAEARSGSSVAGVAVLAGLMFCIFALARGRRVR